MAYVILALGVVPSVILFYLAEQGEYGRFQMQARIAAGWYTTRMRVRNRLDDDVLNGLLRKSGLNIRAPHYHYVRLGVTAVFAVVAIAGLAEGRALPVVFPVLMWLILEYRRPFPMYYGFLWMQKQASSQRDRALYLLYRLLLQEIVAFRDHPIAVNEMLKRQLHRVPVLRPFLKRCLDEWLEDPMAALQHFGEDVGTKQAKTFSQMLMEIEQAGIGVALDVFQNNHESFRTERLAAFRTQLNTRALVGTALTLVGLGAATYDTMVVIQLYTGDLLRLSTGG
ncbi:hypothetical protein [Alicyclobacillus macrosporangiidus]|uniref:hypothetical protein n=1 Tax=Alicyclobacillus macrosporangiidus TaxID=392015 RepID=UPI0004970979|nr:hypothetical protein [Alicyclobacillus macrosporangiidus]